MKVINLFGGPGSGKSTQAAGLFYKMKCAGMNVELVTEFAKDLVWEDRLGAMLDQQDYIFAQQNRRLHRLRGKVDYAITDSPLLIGIVYMTFHETQVKELNALILHTFRSYDNFNFFLRSDIPYQPVGRRQDFREAIDIGAAIQDLLNGEEIKYTPIRVQQSDDTIDQMLDVVQQHITEEKIAAVRMSM